MPLDESAVSSLRAEFPALQQTAGGRPLIFFDGPGGTQVHGSVIEAMRRYYTEANSNSHGAFLYSRRTSETVDEARRALADFLNAPRPEEIVFGPNMTTLTFNLSRAIGRTLAPGDEIIVSAISDFGSAEGIVSERLVPVFADVRVVPQALEETYQIIREAL